MAKVPSGATVASRLPSAAVADLLEWGPDTTAQDQFQAVLSQEMNLQSLVAQSPGVPALSDDRPINEYYLLRDWFHHQKLVDSTKLTLYSIRKEVASRPNTGAH